MAKLKKKERQQKVLECIEVDPFLTDEMLAKKLDVSIQTIRLDRILLEIPELRVRIQQVAKKNAEEIKSIPLQDVIGEVLDIEINHRASSFFVVEKEHTFHDYDIARGHFLFGQANSLCVAVLDKELPLTKSAEVRYLKSAYVGDKVISHADVKEMTNHEAIILVESFVDDLKIFTGKFVMYFKNEGEK